MNEIHSDKGPGGRNFVLPVLRVGLFSFMLGAGFCNGSVEAAEPAPVAGVGEAEMDAMSDTELATLDRFLSLSDQELDQIEQAVARIRRMSPAERAAFRTKILSYRRLPDTERVALRNSWGQSSDEERELWREMMHSLPNEERNALRDEMQSLAPGERADFRARRLAQWQKERAEEVAD